MIRPYFLNQPTKKTERTFDLGNFSAHDRNLKKKQEYHQKMTSGSSAKTRHRTLIFPNKNKISAYNEILLYRATSVAEFFISKVYLEFLGENKAGTN